MLKSNLNQSHILKLIYLSAPICMIERHDSCKHSPNMKQFVLHSTRRGNFSQQHLFRNVLETCKTASIRPTPSEKSQKRRLCINNPCVLLQIFLWGLWLVRLISLSAPHHRFSLSLSWNTSAYCACLPVWQQLKDMSERLHAQLGPTETCWLLRLSPEIPQSTPTSSITVQFGS